MIGSSRVPDWWTSLAISIPRTEAAVLRHFQECLWACRAGYNVTRASAHPVRRADPPC
jgi:hypothetical protein